MKLSRMAIKFLILLLVFGTTVSVIAQSDVTITTTSAVNLRSGTDIEFDSVGVVPFNTTLPALGRNEDTTWVQVNYNGTIGWIALYLVNWSGDLDSLPVGGVDATTSVPVNLEASTSESAQPAATGAVSGRNDSVINIRSGPTINSGQLGQLPAGTTLNLNGRLGSGNTLWVRFDYNGQPAWVAGWLLNISGDVNALPDVEAAQNAALQVCGGGSAPEAPAYNGGPGVHPVLLLNESGGRHAWDSQLGSWGVGSTPGSAELIACVGEQQRINIQTCPYYGPSIDRYHYVVNVRLISAQTGQQIANTSLTGADPRECRSQEPYNLTVLDGSPVSYDQLHSWLQPFVSP
jgi:uncharacterized protein YraI